MPALRSVSSRRESVLKSATWIPEKRRLRIDRLRRSGHESRGFRQIPDDVVALHAVDEEAEDVHDRERRQSLSPRRVILSGVVDRNRHHPRAARRARRARLRTAVDHRLRGRVPLRVRILRDETVHALFRRADHVAVLALEDVADANGDPGT
jgi:hypothetical protein